MGKGKPPAGRGTWTETLKMNLAGKEGREEASRQKEHSVQLFYDMRLAGGHQRLMEASVAPIRASPRCGVSHEGRKGGHLMWGLVGQPEEFALSLQSHGTLLNSFKPGRERQVTRPHPQWDLVGLGRAPDLHFSLLGANATILGPHTDPIYLIDIGGGGGNFMTEHRLIGMLGLNEAN